MSEIPPGPPMTENVTAPPESEVAESTIESVTRATVCRLKTRFGSHLVTLTSLVTDAGAYSALPATLAVTLTVPAPVKLSVLPLIEPGPAVTEKLTARPELEVAGRTFLNAGGAVVDRERNRLSLSRIFKWYGEDFGETAYVQASGGFQRPRCQPNPLQ